MSSLIQVSGVVYSHIIGIVPIEYTCNLDETQTTIEVTLSGINAVNYDPNQPFEHNKDTSIGVQLLNSGLMQADYFYWDGCITDFVGSGVISGDNQQLAMDLDGSASWMATYGESSNWTVVGGGSQYFYKSAGGESSFCVKIDDAYLDNYGLYELNIGDDVGENVTYRNICFGKGFDLRMYSEITEKYTFISRSSRTGTGTVSTDFDITAQNQLQKTTTLVWKELTQAEYDNFTLFFDAFRGDITAPWYMVIVRADVGNSMNSYLVSIDKNSVNVTYDKKNQSYDMSLRLIEYLVDY